MTVLVVDDEEMIRTIGEKVLRRAGYDVITAATGRQAVDLFAKQPERIAVVLIDISMPDMTGIETIRELRAISPTIPCIISSGHNIVPGDIPDDIANNIELLQKPYRSQALAAVVKSLISRQK